jgi:N-acetylglucosaminyldiphosphoundecaprenol N-acetyl-beta-D-mannosaminyltransferase
MESKKIIDISVTALTYNEQISAITKWAKCNLSKVVCIANVHMLIEAHRDSLFGAVLNQADLVTPDGMPLVWMLRLSGAVQQDRVAGVDVLEGLCKQAIENDISVYFIGSQLSILDKLRVRLERNYPELKIAGMAPLPFRPLTDEEDQALIQSLNQSGAGLVFVSLGCPKQEKWMSEHKGKISAVMVGLGGAFPVYAGIHRRAPKFFRQTGLEWLYRLMQEPKRLWKRYATTIPVFLWLVAKQILIEFNNSSTQTQDFEVEHNFGQIGPKKMLVNTQKMPSSKGRQLILLSIEGNSTSLIKLGKMNVNNSEPSKEI